jgi:ATP-dependent RNA helicase DDX31/DBP7
LEKHIFHIKKLHLGHVAKSFGLREAPSDISKKLDNRNDNKKTKILNKEKNLQKNIKKRNFEIMKEFSVGNYESMIGPTTKRKRKGK